MNCDSKSASGRVPRKSSKFTEIRPFSGSTASRVARDSSECTVTLFAGCLESHTLNRVTLNRVTLNRLHLIGLHLIGRTLNRVTLNRAYT